MIAPEANRPERDRGRLKELLARVDRLPSPSAVATKVLELAMDDGVTMEQVARQIVLDHALTVRVLAHANSAVHGISGRVDNVEQACMLLGLSVLQNIALSVLVRDTLVNGDRGRDRHLVAVWKHSLASAVTAGLIAEEHFPRYRHAAFAAGMIHDSGRLALMTLFPKEYEALLDLPRLDMDALLEAEEATFGADHALVGKWLLTSWRLPEELVEACWLHHHGAAAMEGGADGGTLSRIVALANILAHEIMLDVYSQGMEAEKFQLARALGLSRDALEALSQAVGARYAERASIFDLDGDELHFYREAAERARGQLSRVSIDMQRQNSRLSQGNAILDTLARAGCKLTEASSAPSLLVESARLLASLPYTRGGCLYRLFETEGRFEGVLLQPEGRLVPLRGQLEDDGTLRIAGVEKLPTRLAALLAGYAERKACCCADGASSLGSLMTMGGYCVLPLGSKGSWFGELVFETSEDAGQESLPKELSGYVQLAGLVGACLGRLEQDERLEERAERLADALRKLQQMHAKMLRTERLAAVGQLAAGAAHEINNPLAIIYARTQLLELKEEDGRKQEVLKLILSQIERISGILTSLMDFARPAPPQFGPVDVPAVVSRALNLASGGLEKKGIAARMDCPAPVPEIEGDSRQLEQVFLNLILNAEHAMPGGGKLLIRIRATERPGRVLVSVLDTGTGIPREQLSKVFDPFFTTKEEGKGTGLGLSTSYGIVSSHGGEISLRSEVGKGTEVLVQLPLTQKGQSPLAPARPEAPVRQLALVLDNRGELRAMLQSILAARGLDPEAPTDLATTLARLAAGSFHVAILDMRLLRRLPAADMERLAGIGEKRPVVAVGESADAEAAASLKATRFITLPASAETLVAVMEGVLRDHG